MSLEVAIQENTNALRTLIDVMSSVKIAPPVGLNDVTGGKSDAEVVDIKDAKAKKATKATKPAAKKESKAEKSKVDEDSKPAKATYDDAASAVTTLARTKGRDVAIEVLSNFGIKKLPDAKPEQYAEIIAACTEVGEA